MAVGPEDAKTLERFADPKAVYESYSALRNRLASGELKAVTPFPKDGTPEAKSAWRKEAGLPEAPEKYDLTGLTVEETDKPIVDAYLKAAHENNLSPDQAKALLKTRADIVAKAKADQTAAYDAKKQETSDKLNAEWGADYRRNQNLIAGLLDAHMANNPDLKGNVLRAVETNAEYARFMAAVALKINPTATLFHAGTEGAPGGLEARLAEIKKLMTTDRKAYNDPKISGPEGEYPRLLKAYENIHGKPFK